MSSSKKPSTGSSSGGLKKCEGSGSRTVVGVSQSTNQSVDEYKAEFFEKAKRLDLLGDEMLLAKWFRDGLRDDIKGQVRRIKMNDTMEEILDLAYFVENRMQTTPEESEDKRMIICEDNIEKEYEDTDEDPNEDPEEDPEEDDPNYDPNLPGDYQTDSRYWDYDDLDQWGQGDPPED